MQSLWSRAAQAQSSCRCRFCHHAGKSIARRSTTAASRRKVSAADIFTACYTTILGTAVVIDTHKKDARRHELDRKLEQARAALDQQGEESKEASPVTADTSQSRNFGSRRRRRQKTISGLLQEFGALSPVTHRPLPRPSWLQDQLDWLQIETSIIAEEYGPDYVLREPRSVQQLSRTTTTVVDLVNRLSQQSQYVDSGRSQDVPGYHEDGTESEARILERLEAMKRSPHFPSYEQHLTDAEGTADTRYLLGQAIRRLFNQAASTKEIVGKICFNLMVSSAPPTMHTYNTLIAGFNRIQRPDLAQAVIDSYIHTTAWPATQQTMICLVNHYRGTNQIKELRDTVKRMRGVKDTGLHFHIINKSVLYSRDWLAWAKEVCASRKYAYVERARRGDELFNTLIKAWLHLGDVGNAAMVFIACIRNEGTVPIQTLHALFTACLAVVNTAAARQLVKGIAKNITFFAIYFQRIIRQEPTAICRQTVTSFSHVLDICLYPFKEVSGRFGDTFEHVTRELKSIIRTIQIHLEIRETGELCKDTAKQLQSGGSLISYIENAIRAFEFAQRNRLATSEAFIYYNRLSQLSSIERRYQDMEAKIGGISAQAKARILKLKTGYELDPSSLLGHIQPDHHLQRHRYFALCNALKHIQIHDGPMTQDDVKAQLLQRLPNPTLVERFQNSGHVENLTIRALTTFYAPNTFISRKPKYHGHNRSIKQLEQELDDAEDIFRATLFAHLEGDRQRKMRFMYSRWDEMPLSRLVRYHLQRTERMLNKLRTDTPPVTDAQQTGVIGDLDRGNPATGVKGAFKKIPKPPLPVLEELGQERDAPVEGAAAAGYVQFKCHVPHQNSVATSCSTEASSMGNKMRISSFTDTPHWGKGFGTA
ncbi:hypothetical protein F5B20DRAFT_522624 [Whalleya microplaca]|nr:hypothetical protein F5B20DRAFT_522624 [Whalleya microplaca]